MAKIVSVAIFLLVVVQSIAQPSPSLKAAPSCPKPTVVLVYTCPAQTTPSSSIRVTPTRSPSPRGSQSSLTRSPTSRFSQFVPTRSVTPRFSQTGPSRSPTLQIQKTVRSPSSSGAPLVTPSQTPSKRGAEPSRVPSCLCTCAPSSTFFLAAPSQTSTKKIEPSRSPTLSTFFQALPSQTPTRRIERSPRPSVSMSLQAVQSGTPTKRIESSVLPSYTFVQVVPSQTPTKRIESSTLPSSTFVQVVPSQTPSKRIEPSRSPSSYKVGPTSTQAPPSSTPLPSFPPGADSPVPQPVISHPRLWITVDDLPALRARAVSSNPMYQIGFLPGLQSALDKVTTQWSLTTYGGSGTPLDTWEDTGSTNWERDCTEAYALYFALAALIQSNNTNALFYASISRDLLMYVINQALSGPGPSYQEPSFSTYNRAAYWGEAFGLTFDWLQYFPGLITSTDKANVRAVFLQWCAILLEAATAGNEHPTPIGIHNDPVLLADYYQLRWTANNYFSNHARLITLMSLSIDTIDDPKENPALKYTDLGNTLRSYILNAVGAWLYQQYAMYENETIVGVDYGIDPSAYPSVGSASGGLSPEGFMYGESLSYIWHGMLALKTAGFDTEALAGKQIKLMTSEFWNRFVTAYLSSVTPTTKVLSDWQGDIYEMASYGDSLHFYVTEEAHATFLLMALFDIKSGSSSRLSTLRWCATNLPMGGVDHVYNRAGGGNIWGNSYATYAILHFLAFDASVIPASLPDPRQGLSTLFVDYSLRRVLARTNWSPQSSFFSYLCAWNGISHQHGDCMQFEFWRNGEWLTKERTGYSLDGWLDTSIYHNTLSLQNTVLTGASEPCKLQWYEDKTWLSGGQLAQGNSGVPNHGVPLTFTTSSDASFVFAESSNANMYNRYNYWEECDNALDILHASRSIIWLKADIIVVYDRATSQTANRFKRWHLNLVAAPTFSNGNRVVTIVTPLTGQKLVVESLLPLTANMSSSIAPALDLIADNDPITHLLMVEDPSNPSDIRFLHVLQGLDSGASKSTNTVIKGNSTVTGGVTGPALDGVAINSAIVVMFPSSFANFTSMTFSVESTSATHYVTGLAPRNFYDVTTTALPQGGISVHITVGSMYMSDQSGVLKFITPVVSSSVLQDVHGSNKESAADTTLNPPAPSQSAGFIAGVTVGVVGSCIVLAVTLVVLKRRSSTPVKTIHVSQYGRHI